VAAGNRLLEYGKSKEALKLFEKALAERPDGVDALLGIGYADLDTEHFNAAADQFRRVLELAPGNGEAIIGLAQTYKLRGDKARALEFYQRYLKELPTGSKAAMAESNVKALQGEAPKPESRGEAKPETRGEAKPEGGAEAKPQVLPQAPAAPTDSPPPP
jgi:tetratricopeptide (TPR) repeat protein